MDKQELIDFLHENLKIEVERQYRQGMYEGNYTQVKIKLVLDNYEFSECTFDIVQ